jgi:peptidyl-dipeptidase Dcp
VYGNLTSSVKTPALQEVEKALAGPLAAFTQQIYTYPGLFEKVDQVHEERHSDSIGLTSEQIRLVERFHIDFVMSGAKLNTEKQQRYSVIMEKLAELTTQFTINVMKDEEEIYIELKEEDLVGCPSYLVSAAKSAAQDLKLGEDKYVITLSRSLVVPFLTFSPRRELREDAFKKWTSRGELVASRDNKALIKEILTLRAEQASIHGYSSFADFQLSDTMAKKPESVMKLLNNVWPKAKLSADRERMALEDFIASKGENLSIKPWDWRYIAEKVRNERYDLDESELKPYFNLDRMVEAIFDCANKLFGLRFIHRSDIVSYHPDVKTYEVHETVNGEDKLVAVFLHDNYRLV